MKIKLNGKEYTVKFGYAPVVKNKIIPRLVGMEQQGEGLEVIAGDEQKIDKMQKRIDELEDKFSRLCQKLGIDESEV